MKSNLQANGLNYNLVDFKSELVELSKKDIFKIEENRWLKIEKEYLHIYKDKSAKKLYANGEYLLIKDTKYKKVKNRYKSNFYLKIDIDRALISNNTIISKMPKEALMVVKNIDYAKVNLYITDNIYIEIKEIL